MYAFAVVVGTGILHGELPDFAVGSILTQAVRVPLGCYLLTWLPQARFAGKAEHCTTPLMIVRNCDPLDHIIHRIIGIFRKKR